MGTIVSAQLQEKNQKHFEPLFQIFNKLDQKFSTYKSTSEVSLLNQGKSVTPCLELTELLATSEELNKISQGYFNIYTGKQSLLARKSKVNLFLKPMTVSKYKKYLAQGEKLKLLYNAQIDFGGIAKGFAVDKAIEHLKNNNISQAQISASGDIGCLGPCTLFIQNPLQESPMVQVSSKNERFAISTSGNYRKKSISHIINPKTGKFVNHWLSVTLLGKGNNTQLDGITTAVFSIA